MIAALLVMVVSVLLVLTLYPMVLWFARYSVHGSGTDVEKLTNMQTYKTALSHMSLIAALVALAGVFAVWRRGSDLKYRTALVVLLGVLLIASILLYILGWYMASMTAADLAAATWMGITVSILQVLVSLCAVFAALLTAYSLYVTSSSGKKSPRGKADSFNYANEPAPAAK